jgi:ubiquinone/menaquinone biosynthesis C-methylase UbiE
MTKTRYQVQPWHPALLRKFSPYGRLLEIGCGAGTDHAELARMADSTVGVDLAHKGAWLTGRRMALEGRPSRTLVADGEELPFPDCTFDSIYSFGVIHHTDHPESVAAEMYRVMNANGRFMVALYHKVSLVTLYILVKYFMTGAFLREHWSKHLGLIEAGAEELEQRPIVKLYSRRQARHLFQHFTDVTTEIVHPPTDRVVLGALARSLGWYVVVYGRKS